MHRGTWSLLRLYVSLSVFTLLTWCRSWSSDGAAVADNNLRHSKSPAGFAHNSLSYLYIVGVEGVGHHGISPAIAAIAGSCNKHILYESKPLSWCRQEKSAWGIKSQMTKFKLLHYPSDDVVILEDSSFPDAKMLRNSTQEQKKLAGHYDLEWVFDQLKINQPNMNIKYLYLNRDFYRSVASHPEFDGGFEQHAQVLHDFMVHINSEYNTINAKQHDIWRQISYEWFTNMDKHNCTAIVSAVIDFMQWDNCDVDAACRAIHKIVCKERLMRINPSEYAYAQTFNVTLPIPVLDISPGRVYNFTTVVSKRHIIDVAAAAEEDRVKHNPQPFALHRANLRSNINKLEKKPKTRVCVPVAGESS